ncbi:MAG TPA: hypothetical protein DCQ06_05320 [Myxococcales bacterium]|nr:hypothetical protein [Myxococcales bacterium]HAN30998.1 hypothetical protein [Myxococcales bacterium]
MLRNYAAILDRCEPFVIARRDFSSLLPREVLGFTLDERHYIDPQQTRHAEFMQLLRRLDELCFGPNGMPMPSWVFYDCAVMPGLFFGFGLPAAEIEPWCRQAMHIPEGYVGLVPVSQFIAIPTLENANMGDTPATWLMYSAESINQVSPGFAPAGLLRLTLALGLQMLPMNTLLGTTQWRSHKLSNYIELGPLELVTAYTPAHTIPSTLSFRLARDRMDLLTLLSSPGKPPGAPPPNDWLNPDDPQALEDLQKSIEVGDKVLLVGQPQYYGSEVRVPLYRQRLAT